MKGHLCFSLLKPTIFPYKKCTFIIPFTYTQHADRLVPQTMKLSRAITINVPQIMEPDPDYKCPDSIEDPESLYSEHIDE